MLKRSNRIAIVISCIVASQLQASQMSREESISTPQEFVLFSRNATSYQILGVRFGADENAIQKAFRTLSLKFHPDKWKSLGQEAIANEAFKIISNARDILLEQVGQFQREPQQFTYSQQCYYPQQEAYVKPEQLQEKFFHAAADGDIGKIKDLMPAFKNLGINIDVRDRDGNTALLIAAAEGNVETIKILKELGADVNAQRAYGSDTSLMYAAENGNIAALIELINLGANIHARNDYGGTALMNAAARGHEKIIDKLVQSGADVNAKDDNDSPSIIFAARNGNYSAVIKLLSLGSKVNIKTKDGETALGEAADPQIILELLRYGANPDKEFLDKAQAKPEIMKVLEQFNKEKKEETLKQANVHVIHDIAKIVSEY